MLFTFDGKNFVQENPLLTACEFTGYTGTVTDYYHVRKRVMVNDDKVVFQLRELENEITYLNDLELITVDHPADMEIGCSIDGHIFGCQTAIAPIAAVDDHGQDQLAAVLAEDQAVFSASSSGYIDVTFPKASEDLVLSVPPVMKQYCPPLIPKETPDPDGRGTILNVALKQHDGTWIDLASLPPRENPGFEFVVSEMPRSSEGEPIVFRLAWEGAYNADIVRMMVLSDESPRVTYRPIQTGRLAAADRPDAGWNGFSPGQPLVLKKGETFEITFDVGPEPGPGATRDYVIRAKGRYEPDYAAFDDNVPGAFRLYNNYPNPFNPTTVITFDLPAPSEVTLEVFNVLGQRVKTLIDQRQRAGHHRIEWNATDENGHAVASGVYFYRLTAEGFTASKKMTLVK